LVIAQRTANISKTILTQCNTIISFKQFDNTSRDFLINHFGEEFVKSLPVLKFRRAIISGKALVSDMPIMFEVPFVEGLNADNQHQGQENAAPEDEPEIEGVRIPDAEVRIEQGSVEFKIF
jgi:hypothetical protein